MLAAEPFQPSNSGGGGGVFAGAALLGIQVVPLPASLEQARAAPFHGNMFGMQGQGQGHGQGHGQVH